ncbi:transposable element Tcb1 transposase [Trichonephila clavipes]|nr:transposable element Tcb1 transposase [Trichonephila clavipes]
MEQCAGSQRPTITNSPEDMHVTRMDLMDCAATSRADNARPHAAGIVWIFLDTENYRLLPWTLRSQNLSPIENVWSMVVERLARHHTPVATADELWYPVEAAWLSVPVWALQSMCDSMPRRISAVITAPGGCVWC